jgi:retron-type reverse transcriptase
VYIPKPDGRQRAVAALLNAIYEEDFLGVSYGFRPGRNARDAMDALCVGIHSKKVSYILDADIRSFLDRVSYYTLVHEAWPKRSDCEQSGFHTELQATRGGSAGSSAMM